jgi:SHS2 domain-containing protein
MTRETPSGASQPDFQIVEHMADWSIRVRAGDFGQLLATAAFGMSSLLVNDPALLPLDEERHIEVRAFDRESILVEWLSELAYLAERDSIVFRDFEMHVATPTQVSATVRGARASQMHKHIKAVTYHNLEVKQTADGLEAEIVFDV